MAPFARLIRFESDGNIYFSDLGVDTIETPPLGSHITAYLSLNDLIAEKNSATVSLGKVGSITGSLSRRTTDRSS
jgi:hypothetical protein